MPRPPGLTLAARVAMQDKAGAARGCAAEPAADLNSDAPPPSPRPYAALPLPAPAAEAAAAAAVAPGHGAGVLFSETDGLEDSSSSGSKASTGGRVRSWLKTMGLDDSAAIGDHGGTSGRLVLQVLLPAGAARVLQGLLVSRAADVFFPLTMGLGVLFFTAASLSRRVPVQVGEPGHVTVTMIPSPSAVAAPILVLMPAGRCVMASFV